MPTRLCANPGCPNPATYRGQCATCNQAKEQQTNRAGHHIYRTRKWQLLRRRVLYDQPLCPGVLDATCGDLAEHAHHIIDIADGGDPWARANLIGLCASCHSRITRQESKGA
jgi:5-methylcytosine-specific restriction endonuclease McrA